MKGCNLEAAVNMGIPAERSYRIMSKKQQLAG